VKNDIFTVKKGSYKGTMISSTSDGNERENRNSVGLSNEAFRRARKNLIRRIGTHHEHEVERLKTRHRSSDPFQGREKRKEKNFPFIRRRAPRGGAATLIWGWLKKKRARTLSAKQKEEQGKTKRLQLGSLTA